MPRKPDERIEKAREMYLSGKKLNEIASILDIPEGTVRSWKNRHKWNENSNATLQKNICNVAKNKKKKKCAVIDEVNEIFEESELTDKQQLFCCIYIKCFNATKAYQKAYGVDYSTALVAGPRLLGNVRIKKEIERLKQSRLNREMLSEYDIFQKYMDIAFADITDYVEFGRETVPVMGAFGPIVVKDKETGKKKEITKEINVVRFKDNSEVDGTLITEIRQGKDGASIKLADRMKALDWLANHMNLATDEQKARMKKLEAETERIRNSGSGEGEDDGVEIINDCPQ